MPSLRSKITRLAFFDGVGLVLMGVLSVSVGILWRDWTGFLVGVSLTIVAGAELHGRRLLLSSNKRATLWLMGSQGGLLVIIISYCGWNLLHPSALPEPVLEKLRNFPGINDLGMDWELVLPRLSKLVYAVFLAVSLLYQGGMASFYWRNTPRALLEPPPPPLG